MNEYLVNSTDLVSVADAIREKTGSSEALIFPDGFVNAIDEMSGDSGNGESSNGDTTLADSIIEGSITEISSNVTKVRPYAFYNYEKLVSVNLPEAVELGEYAFCGCENVAKLNLPKVETISDSAIERLHALKTLDLPKVTSLEDGGVSVMLSLTALLLRSELMCSPPQAASPLGSSLHFTGETYDSYNPNGLKDGYIYVPSVLVSEYESNFYWKTYATQFRALEDFTVDGTTTGELDPNKVKENGLTVWFNAGDGGIVNEAWRVVVFGEAYGELPTPTRDGYTFNCWKTGSYGDGDEVTADTIVTQTTPHTLYASWTSTSGGGNEEPT